MQEKLHQSEEEVAFWEKAYIAAMGNMATAHMPEEAADRALEKWRERTREIY